MSVKHCKTDNTIERTESEDNQFVRIVVVGDEGVGKSALVRAYMHVNEPFTFDYEPTKTVASYQVSHPKSGCHNSEAKNVIIADFGSQNDIEYCRQYAYKEATVVMVCFSMDDPNSFAHVRDKWVPEIHSQNCQLPIILVATKTDQGKHSHGCLLNRNSEVINHDTIKKLSKDIHARAVFHTSAVTKEQVTQAFEKAISMGMQKISMTTFIKKRFSYKKQRITSSLTSTH